MLRSQPICRRHAFTLIELLVVIGIVVVLGGLLLVGVTRSYKSGVRARASADLTLIGTALEAYKADFGDYPRFDNDNTANLMNASLTSNRGAVLLCRALLGPGPDVNQNSATWGCDGALGNGFRTRPGGAGKVYGPYLQPDKFIVGSTNSSALDTANYQNAALLDRYGNAICYLPASTPTPNIAADEGFIASQSPTGSTAPTYVPLYNFYDITGVLNRQTSNSTTQTFTLTMFQTIMGATSTGAAGVNPTYTGPYLLWSAGPDLTFGFDQNNKTDDVTNFDIPPQFRK